MSTEKNKIQELQVENNRLRREIEILKTNQPNQKIISLNKRLETINDIIHFAVSELTDVDKILPIICSGIRQIFGFHKVGIMLINEEKEPMVY